ncbi:hypothetical protein ACPOL_7199 (plasmid) [Acidisarcina polymorpha]|uniref:DinB family protein n=1 Tax=Acidisarcina polymorpha TaxID=2211140 RepID=A0A2Z5GBK6_9BACT|nr:DinB family protein [Acidisarcina polymorpha]AXC16389.1 hypothetical protein ACPOL_7199 [Acidisarcina polymorpha]
MPDFDPVGTIEFFRERHRVESATTAKVLHAIPADMLSYRTHPNSPTAGTTAWTIVRCLEISNHLTSSDSTEVPRTNHPDHVALLAEFHHSAERLQQQLVAIDPTDWLKERKVTSSGIVILTQPLGQILWLFLFDGIHHRGQLSTYLRPMGAAVPSIYGPSADTTA